MAPGVYLHIPFCKSRCSYCDFATDVYRDAGTVERYVEAISSEILAFGVAEDRTTPSAKRGHPSFGRRGTPGIDTIYFGGGTPSLLSASQVEKILDKVRTIFNVADDSEITMEMNPATVTPETLAAFRSSGINRASFGVQTFNDRDLKLLARGHDANDARNTFRMLRDAGFDNVSFDLIAGLPGQSIDDWKRNLDEAVAMQPEHLSLDLLEIHEGTPLAEQVRSGRRPVPDENVAAEMYELMVDTLEAVGYEQYEISNFARPSFQSRHNSKYWRLDPVYGFGVSAHSFDGSERYANERDTAGYVRSIESGGSAEVSRESIDTASEFVFLGLRLTSGIDLAEYKARFSGDLVERYRREIDELIDKELIDLDDARLRLTQKGMLFSNEVFAAFV
jgi:oxygen-independent coproporphyrinogen-3 oxidase